MYWADAGTKRIYRAGLDGRDVEALALTGLDLPAGVPHIPEPTTPALLPLAGLALIRRRWR